MEQGICIICQKKSPIGVMPEGLYCPTCASERIGAKSEMLPGGLILEPSLEDKGFPRHEFLPRREEKAERRATALRAVYNRGFDAALPMLAANEPPYSAVECANLVALEAVRTYAARMDNIKRVIKEGTE